MKTNTLIFLSLSLMIFGCRSNHQDIDTTTVSELNVERYMGTWHEIARFQHSFEKDLVGVTATYSLRDDGKIDVVNAGFKHTLDGEYKEAKGKAKIPNPDEPGKLKVAFFLFFYAAYNIMELDDDYQHVLIGSSSPDYLWILSRTPQLDEATYQQLVDEAKDRGYDTSKLYRVPQN
jgi:lipocalin